MSNYCSNAFCCSNSTLKKNNVEKYPWLKDVVFRSFRHATRQKNDSCKFERFNVNLSKSQTSFNGYVPNTS